MESPIPENEENMANKLLRTGDKVVFSTKENNEINLTGWFQMGPIYQHGIHCFSREEYKIYNIKEIKILDVIRDHHLDEPTPSAKNESFLKACIRNLFR